LRRQQWVVLTCSAVAWQGRKRLLQPTRSARHPTSSASGPFFAAANYIQQLPLEPSKVL
jgi:hypothetical protein